MGKHKHLFNTIALGLGLALILIGLIFLFLNESHVGANGGLTRASTSIEFGADYYTTSAQYSGLAANALCDIFALLKYAFAALFIFLGGLDVCIFLPKCLVKDSNNDSGHVANNINYNSSAFEAAERARKEAAEKAQKDLLTNQAHTDNKDSWVCSCGYHNSGWSNECGNCYKNRNSLTGV